jgi:hypothetical protein
MHTWLSKSVMARDTCTLRVPARFPCHADFVSDVLCQSPVPMSLPPALQECMLERADEPVASALLALAAQQQVGPARWPAACTHAHGCTAPDACTAWTLNTQPLALCLLRTHPLQAAALTPDNILVREGTYRAIGECFPHLRSKVTLTGWWSGRRAGLGGSNCCILLQRDKLPPPALPRPVLPACHCRWTLGPGTRASCASSCKAGSSRVRQLACSNAAFLNVGCMGSGGCFRWVAGLLVALQFACVQFVVTCNAAPATCCCRRPAWQHSAGGRAVAAGRVRRGAAGGALGRGVWAGGAACGPCRHCGE